MKIKSIFRVTNRETLYNPKELIMKKSLLSFDYYLQLFSFCLIMSTSVFIFPLILLLPFGVYQVVSAGIKGFALNKYQYRVFALAAGLYGTIIMYLGFGGNGEVRHVIGRFDNDLVGVVTVVAFFIIPIISAVYYLRQSYKDWQAAVEEEAVGNDIV